MDQHNESIVITGGNGMLGRSLAGALHEAGFAPVSLAHAECDITSEHDVRHNFQHHRPALLLNCAAHTKVDQCEDEPDRANAINGHAVGMLAQMSREFGTRLVHVSTDAVFSGARSLPYSPDDPPGPISAYGRSKLLGEQLLRQVNPPGWLIVRTAWLFGDGHCFPRIIADRARAGQPLQVVSDQVGSPTYADDLAAAMIELVKRNAQGIWHVTNGGRASWFDVAIAILDELSMDIALEPVFTAQYLRIRPRQAPRPAYSVLDCSAFTRTVGRPIRHWHAALREYCGRFLKGGRPGIV